MVPLGLTFHKVHALTFYGLRDNDSWFGLWVGESFKECVVVMSINYTDFPAKCFKFLIERIKFVCL